MIKVGSKVKAKNPDLPHPMVVDRITPLGFYVCSFAFSGKPAGKFFESQLVEMPD